MQTDDMNGTVELSIEKVAVLSSAETLPFEHDAEINIDTNLDYRPFTLRRARERAIFKVQNEIVYAYGAFCVSKVLRNFKHLSW